VTLELPLTVERKAGRLLAAAHGSASVLDVCCGSKMMWFDRNDDRAIFLDQRNEITVHDTRPGRSPTVIDPTIVGDFRNLPFEDNQFSLVVFDPPHLVDISEKSWLYKKYGSLKGNWKSDLREGFAECFRVLKPSGTLIFKWAESHVPLSEILALTPERPLFGNQTGKTGQTHWVAFQKPNDQAH
jgi:ubiquinone/menaquinone biosynthesis C-methylase UbiE